MLVLAAYLGSSRLPSLDITTRNYPTGIIIFIVIYIYILARIPARIIHVEIQPTEFFLRHESGFKLSASKSHLF